MPRPVPARPLHTRPVPVCPAPPVLARTLPARPVPVRPVPSRPHPGPPVLVRPAPTRPVRHTRPDEYDWKSQNIETQVGSRILCNYTLLSRSLAVHRQEKTQPLLNPGIKQKNPFVVTSKPPIAPRRMRDLMKIEQKYPVYQNEKSTKSVSTNLNTSATGNDKYEASIAFKECNKQADHHADNTRQLPQPFKVIRRPGIREAIGNYHIVTGRSIRIQVTHIQICYPPPVPNPPRVVRVLRQTTPVHDNYESDSDDDSSYGMEWVNYKLPVKMRQIVRPPNVPRLDLSCFHDKDDVKKAQPKHVAPHSPLKKRPCRVGLGAEIISDIEDSSDSDDDCLDDHDWVNYKIPVEMRRIVRPPDVPPLDLSCFHDKGKSEKVKPKYFVPHAPALPRAGETRIYESSDSDSDDEIVVGHAWVDLKRRATKMRFTVQRPIPNEKIAAASGTPSTSENQNTKDLCRHDEDNNLADSNITGKRELKAKLKKCVKAGKNVQVGNNETKSLKAEATNDAQKDHMTEPHVCNVTVTNDHMNMKSKGRRQPNTRETKCPAIKTEPIQAPVQPKDKTRNTTAKTNQPADKICNTTAKTNQPADKTCNTTAKTNQPKDKTYYTTAKTNQPKDKICYTTAKTNQPNGKTCNTTAKTNQTNDKTSNTTAKTNQAKDKTFNKTANTNQPKDKICNTTAKTNQPADKICNTTAKTNQPADKTCNTTAKTNQPKDKTCYTTAKTNQPKDKTCYTTAKTNQPNDKTCNTTAKTNQTKDKTSNTTAKTNQTKDKTCNNTANTNQANNNTCNTTAKTNQPTDKKCNTTAKTNQSKQESCNTTDKTEDDSTCISAEQCQGRYKTGLKQRIKASKLVRLFTKKQRKKEICEKLNIANTPGDDSKNEAGKSDKSWNRLVKFIRKHWKDKK